MWLTKPTSPFRTTPLFSGSLQTNTTTSFLVNSIIVLALYISEQRVLTKEGVFHAYILGLILWSCLGYAGWSTCVLLLILGSLVTRVGRSVKEKKGIAERRGGARGPENVWGAAATSAICAVLHGICSSFTGTQFWLPILRLAFVASLSSKLADTVSSEIGKAYGKRTFLITTWKSVSPGTDGAVSVEGTLCGILSAILLSLWATCFGLISTKGLILSSSAAVFATFIESWIGASYQSKAHFWKLHRKNNNMQLSITTFNLLAPCYRKIKVADQNMSPEKWKQVQKRQPPTRAVCSNASCKTFNEDNAESEGNVSDETTSKSQFSSNALVAQSTWQKGSQFFLESLQKCASLVTCSEVLESEVGTVWKTRAKELTDFIGKKLCSDVVCLQEFWCTQQEWCQIFENSLSKEYDMWAAKRSGDKNDGLMTTVRKDSGWKVVDVEKYYFHDCGERLLLATLLQKSFCEGKETDIVSCLVINTHISFPHGCWGNCLRLKEVKKLMEYVDSYLELHPAQVNCVIISGDFNSALEDPVCEYVTNYGFLNSYPMVHGNESVVTHRNHRGDTLAADKVFFKSFTLNQYKKENEKNVVQVTTSGGNHIPIPFVTRALAICRRI
eukprot:jgi/Galph1/4242/GphlegSOOS_G2896.1